MSWLSRILTLSSAYDLPTNYVAHWIFKIAEQARLLGHSVFSLTGGELTESNLYAAVEQFQPEIIFAGGHGNATTFTGMNLQPLIVACQNDQVLSGAETLFVSCLTGISLVPSVVSKKGLAAAGFTSEFVWIISEPYFPATDPYSKPFERLIVEPAIEVLRGRGWRAWYDKLQAIGREEKARWGANVEDPMASMVLMSIEQDMRAATFMGEGEVVGGGVPVSPMLIVAVLAKVLGII